MDRTKQDTYGKAHEKNQINGWNETKNCETKITPFWQGASLETRTHKSPEKYGTCNKRQTKSHHGKVSGEKETRGAVALR